jgi:hypothetical protein
LALKASSPIATNCSAVIPRRGGGAVVVRGGVVRRGGGRRGGAVLRLDPLDVAAPEVVPPPPISCWAMAAPAVKKSAPASANLERNRIIID